MAKKQITKGDVKNYLRRKVKDNVGELKRQLAVDRININRAIGVGNMNDFVKEYEADFANSTVRASNSEPKTKTLKKLTTNKTEKRR